MTAPATPTPLDWIIDAGHDKFEDVATPGDRGALAVTRALVEAAGESADYDSVINHRALKAAWAAYRAWTPATATGSGDGGGGEDTA